MAERLEQLRDEMRRRHEASALLFERVHPSHRQGAANLIDYLTLRRHDIRALQESLAELGLSSLGRAEEHVITTLERVLDTLHLLAGQGNGRRTEAAVSFEGGRASLEANAYALLGPSRPGRPTRILVTMPSEAAYDFDMILDLVEQGMDCARINCAHDDPDRWGQMVANLRRASARIGRPCPILMDLPGPKLRTGPVEPGPRVVRLRPKRDAWGRPTLPAPALLVAEGEQGRVLEPVGDTTVSIPVPASWLAALRPGDEIRLRDTRASRRVFKVRRTEAGRAWIDVNDTTYLAAGTRLTAPRGPTAAVGAFPPSELALVLRPDDILTLTSDLSPASSDGTEIPRADPTSEHGSGRRGRRPRQFHIGCSSAEALAAQRIGNRVFFDDGRIGGTVRATRPGEVEIEITTAAPSGTKLRSEKGINFPDSDLHLPMSGAEDEAMLRFVVDHADLVGLSFAQEPTDVADLQRRFGELGRPDLGMVLKVETARGFARLPELILTAMASERVGIMVARGDLAVECGFERLAEVQEEMLWLCDAAHVPVIWATQVLDRLAKTGQPSRAEISDAAMGGRAECVMLNKGPHIALAVGTLDDILRRMTSHQRKKAALLRRLRSWSPGAE